MLCLLWFLGKNWKYVLADRLESDADLRREECLVSEGSRFGGNSHVWGCSMVRGEWKHAFAVVRGMSADVRGIFGGVASCPRMSAGFTFVDSERDRSCPRLSAECKKNATAASMLSAVVRAVWKLVNLVSPRTRGRFSGFHSITIPLKVSFPQRQLCGAVPRFTLVGLKKGLKKHTGNGNVQNSKLACQNLRDSYNRLVH